MVPYQSTELLAIPAEKLRDMIMGKSLSLFLFLLVSILLRVSPAYAQNPQPIKAVTNPVLDELTLAVMDLDGRFNFREYTSSLNLLASNGALSPPENGRLMRHFRVVKDVRFSGMPLFAISVERNSSSDAGAALLFEGRLAGDLKPKGMRVLTLLAPSDVKPAIISSDLRIPDHLASRCQLSGWDSEAVHGVIDTKRFLGKHIPSVGLFGRLVFVTCESGMASDPKLTRHENLQTLPSVAAYLKNSSVSETLSLRALAVTRVGSPEARAILSEIGDGLKKIDFPEPMEGYEPNNGSLHAFGFMSGQLISFFGKKNEPWTFIVLREGSALENKAGLEFPQDLNICKETSLANSQTDSDLMKVRSSLVVNARETIRYAYAITCRSSGKN